MPKNNTMKNCNYKNINKKNFEVYQTMKENKKIVNNMMK
jgi:hypothetical protein